MVSRLARLPRDLHYLILMMTHPIYLARMKRNSRSLRRMAESPYFWTDYVDRWTKKLQPYLPGANLARRITGLMVLGISAKEIRLLLSHSPNQPVLISCIILAAQCRDLATALLLPAPRVNSLVQLEPFLELSIPKKYLRRILSSFIQHKTLSWEILLSDPRGRRLFPDHTAYYEQVVKRYVPEKVVSRIQQLEVAGFTYHPLKLLQTAVRRKAQPLVEYLLAEYLYSPEELNTCLAKADLPILWLLLKAGANQMDLVMQWALEEGEFELVIHLILQGHSAHLLSPLTRQILRRFAPDHLLLYQLLEE